MFTEGVRKTLKKESSSGRIGGSKPRIPKGRSSRERSGERNRRLRSSLEVVKGLSEGTTGVGCDRKGKRCRNDMKTTTF